MAVPERLTSLTIVLKVVLALRRISFPKPSTVTNARDDPPALFPKSPLSEREFSDSRESRRWEIGDPRPWRARPNATPSAPSSTFTRVRPVSFRSAAVRVAVAGKGPVGRAPPRNRSVDASPAPQTSAETKRFEVNSAVAGTPNAAGKQPRFRPHRNPHYQLRTRVRWHAVAALRLLPLLVTGLRDDPPALYASDILAKSP